MARVEGSGGGRGARHRGPLGNIPQQHNTVQHHNNGSQGNGLSSSMQGDQVGMEGVEFPMRMVCCMLGGWLTLLFGVMPFLAIYVVPLTPRDDLHWWNTGVIYHIYPRSFQDSNGDGIGDIKGITSRLDHLMDLGVDALWLGPVFKSPMKDFGYDISDYKDIDPVFGTMEDFEELVDTAHSKGLRVVLDVVPNHSSAEHPWFVQSRRREDPYSDYYVWHPGHVLNNGTRAPPNNWMSSFGSSAWTWDEVRREYYLHQFTNHQPDLNYRNPHLQREMEEVLRFWLGRGVDGFRVDAVDALYETDDLAQNEPRSYRENVFNTKPENILSTDWEYLRHSLTRQLPETYQLVSSWRRLFDQYEQETGKHVFLTLEVWSEERMEGWSRYYDHGADMPSNLAMMRHVTSNCAGRCLQRVVDTVLNHVPRDSWPNWAISNHDLGRISNRKSERYLSAMNMLLMTLPGLAFMYYGDEIGMRHISVSYEQTQDPFGVLSGPERYVTLSRDPCRSPMQWSSDAYSGFSKDSTPWLPVHSDYTFNNVQKQNKDRDSLLSSAKELISLRKQQALKWGFHRTAMVTDDVYSFVRYTKGASYSKYLVAINLGDYPETVNFNDEPIGIKPRIPQTGRVVYHTKNFPPESAVAQYSTIHLSNVTLNGGQGIVVQL